MTSTTALAGFAELYERHYEAVFRAALRVTGNPADAEDVLQTVFLRVLARSGDDRGRSAAGGLLPARGRQRGRRPAAPPGGSRRDGLRRSGAACRRRAPVAAEGAAPARHRHPRQRRRNPVPAASRRGAVDRRAGRDVPAREEQRRRPAPPDPAPAAGGDGTLGAAVRLTAALTERTAIAMSREGGRRCPKTVWKKHCRR